MSWDVCYEQIEKRSEPAHFEVVLARAFALSDASNPVLFEICCVHAGVSMSMKVGERLKYPGNILENRLPAMWFRLCWLFDG